MRDFYTQFIIIGLIFYDDFGHPIFRSTPSPLLLHSSCVIHISSKQTTFYLLVTMWTFVIGEALAKILLIFFPRRFANRIRDNTQDMQVLVLRTGKLKSKPKMTFIEGVFATILFDLALFGTSNSFIQFIIRIFTHLQNSWDKPFHSPQVARTQIHEFCNRLSIQQSPWIWELPIHEYKCLNDFFSRAYAPSYFPPLGTDRIVAPACCTLTRFNDDATMTRILIKGCNYRLEDIGLPHEDVNDYKKNCVILGYLSPTDYHRVHSPIEGKCIHLMLEGRDTRSASVKFWGGKFNILNDNKRLVVVIEASTGLRLALVIIGGIGVDTITYNSNMLGKYIAKGEEISTFRAGGSAIAMFTTQAIALSTSFSEASDNCMPVEVLVGESLANY